MSEQAATHVGTVRQRAPRAMEKCDECRRKKIKCTPQYRVWPLGGRCEECQAHGFPCGPNKRKRKVLEAAARSPQRANPDISIAAATLPSEHSDGGGGALGATTLISVQRAPTQESSNHGSFYTGSSVSPLSSSKKTPLALALERLGDLRITFESVQNARRSNAPHGRPTGHNVMADGKLETMAWGVEKDILEALIEVQRLALDVSEDTAEAAYYRTIREIETIESLGCLSCKFSRPKARVLQKLFHASQGRRDRPEAERLLREMLKVPGEEVPVDKQEHAGLLAESLIETSQKMRHMVDELQLPPSNLSLTNPFPPLHRALHYGHDDVIRILSSTPMEALSSLDILRQHAVHVAAETGKTGLLALLSQGDSTILRSRDLSARTSLYIAADHGDEAGVHNLLAAGANPCDRTADGETALVAASRSGYTAVVKRLLNDTRVNVNDPAVNGSSTPLYAAAEAGHLDTCMVLLEAGAMTGVPHLYTKKTAATIAQDLNFQCVADFIDRAASQQQEHDSLESHMRPDFGALEDFTQLLAGAEFDAQLGTAFGLGSETTPAPSST